MSVLVVSGMVSGLIWLIRLEASNKWNAAQIKEIRDQMSDIKRIMEEHATTDTQRILRLHQKVDEGRAEMSRIAQDVARISGYITRQNSSYEG